jgi:hypothetical protein
MMLHVEIVNLSMSIRNRTFEENADLLVSIVHFVREMDTELGGWLTGGLNRNTLGLCSSVRLRCLGGSSQKCDDASTVDNTYHRDHRVFRMISMHILAVNHHKPPHQYLLPCHPLVD